MNYDAIEEIAEALLPADSAYVVITKTNFYTNLDAEGVGTLIARGLAGNPHDQYLVQAGLLRELDRLKSIAAEEGKS